MVNSVIQCFRGEYFFLSNFYEAPILYEGLYYGSNEAAFQAAKVLSGREMFVPLTPVEAKKLGRRVVLRDDWETVKLDVMYNVCKCKFDQHDYLRRKLLQTGSAALIEGNTWGDRYWGRVNGVGDNNLGKILMRLRDEYFL